MQSRSEKKALQKRGGIQGPCIPEWMSRGLASCPPPKKKRKRKLAIFAVFFLAHSKTGFRLPTQIYPVTARVHSAMEDTGCDSSLAQHVVLSRMSRGAERGEPPGASRRQVAQRRPRAPRLTTVRQGEAWVSPPLWSRIVETHPNYHPLARGSPFDIAQSQKPSHWKDKPKTFESPVHKSCQHSQALMGQFKRRAQSSLCAEKCSSEIKCPTPQEDISAGTLNPKTRVSGNPQTP